MTSYSAKAKKQPYIGGIFASGDDEDFTSNSNDISKIFPDMIGDKRRILFETASDGIAHEIRHFLKSHDSIVFYIPENFCASTVNRILLKCQSESIKVEKYTNLKIALSASHAKVVLALHFNCYHNELSEIIGNSLKAPDTLIIEDFVQAPFDIHKAVAHFAVNSLRKVSTIEASVCYSSWQAGHYKQNSNYLALKHNAMQLREEFISNGNKEAETAQLEKLQLAEQASNDSEIYLATNNVIKNFENLDFQRIRDCRTGNLQTLRKLLDKIDARFILSDYFFLMLHLQNRNEARKELAANGIFAPIHWADSLSKESETLISLPVDQRYNEQDMNKIANVILQQF